MFKNKSFMALNASVFFLMLGVGLIVTLLPRKYMLLSGSLSDVGYLASMFAVPYVLVQLPMGRLSDRFGFKPFLVAGYVLCACAGLLYFFCETSGSVLIGRMVQGLGEAPVWALAPAFLSVMVPSDKGRFMGFYNASIHVGLMSGSLLSLVLYGICRENEPFLVFSVLSGAGAVILWVFLDSISSETPRVCERVFSKASLGSVLNRKNVTVFFGIALYGAGYGLFLTGIPAYLISVKHYAQSDISVFFTVFYVGISVSQIIAGPLSDQKGSEPIMRSGLLLAATGLCGFMAFTVPLWIDAFLFMASLGLGVFCISSMTFLNRNASSNLRGTVSGAFYVFWGMGYFFGPMIVRNASGIMTFDVRLNILSLIILMEAISIARLFRRCDNKPSLKK
jgi:MFS family permease